MVDGEVAQRMRLGDGPARRARAAGRSGDPEQPPGSHRRPRAGRQPSRQRGVQRGEVRVGGQRLGQGRPRLVGQAERRLDHPRWYRYSAVAPPSAAACWACASASASRPPRAAPRPGRRASRRSAAGAELGLRRREAAAGSPWSARAAPRQVVGRPAAPRTASARSAEQGELLRGLLVAACAQCSPSSTRYTGSGWRVHAPCGTPRRPRRPRPRGERPRPGPAAAPDRRHRRQAGGVVPGGLVEVARRRTPARPGGTAERLVGAGRRSAPAPAPALIGRRRCRPCSSAS